ncbi:septal ring lytic transglycosylase RlpA family protein [Leptothrix discophora]|uniref:Endolytic peptidoglycan transglycosylase RlpA n=1 Tax=Leptothrix discophora TaxID=89 RepID=A0ABT9G828_LEPDI|nr:septal ring lytic transglycosylase RlpA family protein [Leptothrix discophora]MDP4302652.1 septal ring lytic transglycosylase RlpA family protein [Leptothrix discophora]
MHDPALRATAAPADARPGRRAAALVAGLACALWLAACSTTPPSRAPSGSSRPPASVPPIAPWDGSRDGAEANPPPNLHLVPDAEPRIEPLRQGGPNKPYEIDGVTYTPMTADEPAIERGLASWYGRKFHGRRTASGEVYNMYAMTAAHPTFAIPSYARVRNPANGREVVVRINDRGPFKGGRVIDLSYTAALKLGLLGGVAPVEVERLTHEAIRTGSWQRQAPATVAEGGSPGANISANTNANASASPVAADPQRVAPPAPATLGLVQAPRASDSRTLAPIPAPISAPISAPIPAALPVAVAAAAWDTQPSPAVANAPAPEVMPQERAGTQAARGWWLQLGAFKAAEGAVQFQRKLSGEADWLAPLLTLFREQSLNKLQAGPFPSRAEAQAAAERLRGQLQLVPMLVERR